MIGIKSQDVFSRTVRGLLMIGAILTFAALPRSTSVQQKAGASLHKLPPPIRLSSRLS
jgi:hypothetical protein